MEIVQIISNFSTGGAERFVIDLSNELYRTGNNVTIVRFFDDKSLNLLEEEVSSGIKIVTINKKMGFDFFLLFKVFKYLRKHKAEIVHTHLNSFFYSSLAFLFLRKPKYFYTIHSMPLKDIQNKFEFVIKKLFFKYKLVVPISISNEVHKDSLIHFGKNVRLIFNGRVKPTKTKNYPQVEETIKNFTENYKYPVILNIGNFKEAKNQELLIETVNELNDKEMIVKLLIMGGVKNGERYESLKNQTNPEATLFVGMVNNPTDYMFLSDIFCLSSLWEGMPISLIEAYSTKCLAVCTPAGGIVSMIEDGVNGLISVDFEKENLKIKLMEAIEISEIKKSEILNNAYLDYEKLYSITKSSQEHMKLYLA